MLRKKCNVYSYKYDKKVGLTKPRRQRNPHKKLVSKDQTSKDSKNSPHPQDVMEMCYHIISVM